MPNAAQPLTVRALIEQLIKLPMDLPVAYDGPESTKWQLFDDEIELVHAVPTGSPYLAHVHREGDPIPAGAQPYLLIGQMPVEYYNDACIEVDSNARFPCPCQCCQCA